METPLGTVGREIPREPNLGWNQGGPCWGWMFHAESPLSGRVLCERRGRDLGEALRMPWCLK